MMSNVQAARALGWASLAIGATELAATHWLEDQMGVDDHDVLLRAFGAREIAAGATLLSQRGLTKTLAGGMWARVAGDALDLTLLAAAAPSSRRPQGLAAVAAMVLGVTVVDVLVAIGVQRDLAHTPPASGGRRGRSAPAGSEGDGAGVGGRFAATP